MILIEVLDLVGIDERNRTVPYSIRIRDVCCENSISTTFSTVKARSLAVTSSAHRRQFVIRQHMPHPCFAKWQCLNVLRQVLKGSLRPDALTSRPRTVPSRCRIHAAITRSNDRLCFHHNRSHINPHTSSPAPSTLCPSLNSHTPPFMPKLHFTNNPNFALIASILSFISLLILCKALSFR